LPNDFPPGLDFQTASFAMPKTESPLAATDAPALSVKFPLMFSRLRTIGFPLKEAGIGFKRGLWIPSLAFQ